MPDESLTHLDEEGRAHMVDVSAKPATTRRAVAEGLVRMQAKTRALLMGGQLQKGDALAVARVAGIQGAKRTADLIPLCHPLRLDKVSVDLEAQDEDVVRVRVEAIAHDRTGVEMEALCGVAAAALSIYDMVKGVDRSATIESVRLLTKEGGRSGTWRRAEEETGA
ncbi:MAG: cyclic pyranopterin monophosphate synthase MoaC [Planctomycetota bacterium]|nr:cyclic pyranopterin monophosphate synthase MoaC [Planctomycetota bacterium]